MEGRREGHVNNRIGIFLFAKNEIDFIHKWIDHHLKIADELVIIDNGSSDGTFATVRNRGDAIVLSREESNFSNKGRLCSRAMLRSSADILLPLDADELVVFDDGRERDPKPERVREYLQHLKVDKNDRFQARRTYLKHPEEQGWWGVSQSNKRIFSRSGFLAVDCGFHEGTMEEMRAPIPCDLSYLHYHYRSRRAWEKSTEQKLRARLGDKWNDVQTLTAYNGPSFHTAREFLINKLHGRWHHVGKDLFDPELDPTNPHLP